jgi:peptidyl-prolyl cis-trans isomerase C
MRLRPALLALALSSALFGGSVGISSAGLSPNEVARRNAVAVRVGPKEISVGEIEDRLAAIPRFQLSTMGETADTIRRKFIAEVIVPEVLLSAGAEKQRVDKEIVVQNSILRALANATLRVEKNKVGNPSAIPMDEVRKYYDENKAKFDSPLRYSVWRILCAKREEAVAVIDAAKANLTTDNFTKLAREHSIDKATSMRGGNVGFIDLEGNSNEQGLKVDPIIAKSAGTVKDGQLVQIPVPEGTGFAVVWHKGTVAPAHRSADEAVPQIREAIHRQKVEDATKVAIDDLRREHLTEFNEGVLNGIEVSSADGEVMPRRRPGQAPPLHQIGRAAPKP